MENNSLTPNKQSSSSASPITEPPKYSNVPIKTNESRHNPVLWILSIVGVLAIIGLSTWGIKQSSGLAEAQNQISRLSADKKSLTEEVEESRKVLEEIKESTGEINVEKSGAQAVFFRSGQVYFGKITRITETQIKLENIYYLKSSRVGKTDLDNLPADVTLVKLGCELHGPKDEMFIERKEVEFWENLKNDSQVSQAIATYEEAYPEGQKCAPRT